MNTSTRTQQEHKLTYTTHEIVQDDEGPTPNVWGWGEGVVGDVIKNVKLIQSKFDMEIRKIMISKWCRRDVIKYFQTKNGNKMVIFYQKMVTRGNLLKKW